MRSRPLLLYASYQGVSEVSQVQLAIMAGGLRWTIFVQHLLLHCPMLPCWELHDGWLAFVTTMWLSRNRTLRQPGPVTGNQLPLNVEQCGIASRQTLVLCDIVSDSHTILRYLLQAEGGS